MSTRKQRILIVDDNIDAAVMLGNALTLFGHTVRVAYDGASALAQAQDFVPAVAILDIKLPEMDGYELARRIRALPGLAGISLLAFTGAVEEVDRLHEEDSGFRGTLMKPVDLKKALQLLESLGQPAPTESGDARAA